VGSLEDIVARRSWAGSFVEQRVPCCKHVVLALLVESCGLRLPRATSSAG
jgi:hypothetical protein